MALYKGGFGVLYVYVSKLAFLLPVRRFGKTEDMDALEE